jgi:hypothetical protein
MSVWRFIWYCTRARNPPFYLILSFSTSEFMAQKYFSANLTSTFKVFLKNHITLHLLCHGVKVFILVIILTITDNTPASWPSKIMKSANARNFHKSDAMCENLMQKKKTSSTRKLPSTSFGNFHILAQCTFNEINRQWIIESIHI